MADVDKVQGRVAADVVRVTQGVLSQTGNLHEWRSSTGAILSRVDANGNFIGPGGSSYMDYAQSVMGGMEGHGAPKTGPRVALPSVTGDPAASGSDQTPARIDHIHDRQGDAALYWMAVKP